MKFAAIIAEFNPLSNGHKYIIDKLKEMLPDHKILVIMSGDFVQRGEPSIISKFTRAKHATICGADVVIELPFAYATTSAEDFAYGAIKTLNSIPNVTSLVFGSECGDINLLHNELEKIEKSNKTTAIKSSLKGGNSYASSLINLIGGDILTKPNNMLGIMYLKALKETNSSIKPITIKRIDNYNSPAESPLASSSAIREAIKNKSPNLATMVPSCSLNDLLDLVPPNLDSLHSLISYKILTTSAADLGEIYGISEGIEYKLLEENKLGKTFDNLVENCTSKRYPSSKIKRILCHILLNLTKQDMQAIKSCKPYIKILAINENSKKEILKTLSTANSTLITKKKDFALLDKEQALCIHFDTLSTNIHSILTKSNKDKDFLVKI